MTEGPGSDAGSAGHAGRLTVRCACGWEWAGDVEAIVAAAQDHDRTTHPSDQDDQASGAGQAEPLTSTDA